MSSHSTELNRLFSVGKLSSNVKVSMWIAGALFVVFGLFTIQFAFALFEGTMPWATSLTAAILQHPPELVANVISIEQSHAHYRELAATIPIHAVVGGFVVAFGLLQFIPSLRRNHRQVHRALGGTLAVFMVLVCITALIFLYKTPPSQIFAGEAFWIVLFALACLPLIFLPLAGLAAMSRDFRSHMVWMGLAFCCFLTAPLLRYNYFIVGFLDDQSLNRLVLNSSASVLTQGFLLFMLWLVFVGDKDLPSRTNKQLWRIPEGGLKIAVFGATVSALLMSGLVIFVLEPNYFEVNQSMAMFLIGLVAVTRVTQIVFSKEVWRKGYEGQKPTVAYAFSTLAASAAMLWLALCMDTTAYHAHSIFYALVNFSVIELIVLALAYSTSPLRNGSQLFSMTSAALSWSWLNVPGMVVGIYLAGFEFGVALSCMTLVPPLFVAFGIVVSTGASCYLGISRPGETTSVTNA